MVRFITKKDRNGRNKHIPIRNRKSNTGVNAVTTGMKTKYRLYPYVEDRNNLTLSEIKLLFFMENTYDSVDKLIKAIPFGKGYTTFKNKISDGITVFGPYGEPIGVIKEVKNDDKI